MPFRNMNTTIASEIRHSPIPTAHASQNPMRSASGQELVRSRGARVTAWPAGGADGGEPGAGASSSALAISSAPRSA